MQNNHINKALLRVTTMDSAEFHEAVRLLSAQRSSLLATDHRKVLPGVIGLWRCETDSSREGHHVRCVLQSIINRDTSLILYTNHYRPRSKTRRDARLFTSCRTRQAKITHLSPLHLPPPPNSALTQAWSSHVIYCIEPWSRYCVQRSSSFLRMPTRPCHGSAWCRPQARSHRAAQGQMGPSASARRWRRKMSWCALDVQMSCSLISWNMGGFLFLGRWGYDLA